MSSLPFPITAVRFVDLAAQRVLNDYIFGGRFVVPRAPRGLPTEIVTRFLLQLAGSTPNPQPLANAVVVAVFYETASVVPAFLAILPPAVTEMADFRRATSILHLVGELGDDAQRQSALAYFRNVLLPSPLATQNFSTLLLLAEIFYREYLLRPIQIRLQAHLEALAPHASEASPAGIEYRQGSDILSLEVPVTEAFIAHKQQLLALPPAQQIGELWRLYFGQGNFRHPRLEEWSGRLLRLHAWNGWHTTLIDQLRPLAADVAARTPPPPPPGEPDPNPTPLDLVRAVQAITYFRGRVPAAAFDRYQALENPPGFFLWDDIILSPVTFRDE